MDAVAGDGHGVAPGLAGALQGVDGEAGPQIEAGLVEREQGLQRSFVGAVAGALVGCAGRVTGNELRGQLLESSPPLQTHLVLEKSPIRADCPFDGIVETGKPLRRPQSGSRKRNQRLSPFFAFFGGLMKLFFDRKTILYLLLALTLTAGAPLASAQTVAHLDKHARKIHKYLAKYKLGSYLHFDFRNHTSSNGNLDKLSATSFTFLNTATNKEETRSYDDVAKVKKGETYIGEGTAPHHHFHIPHPF